MFHFGLLLSAKEETEDGATELETEKKIKKLDYITKSAVYQMQC